MKKTTAQTILAAILSAIYGATVWGLPFIVIEAGRLYDIPVFVWIVWMHIAVMLAGLIIWGLVCLVKTAFKESE